MNFDDLPPEIGFLFVTIGQAAVSAHAHDMSKDMFIKFCEEMWNTMELNDPEVFAQVLAQKMASELDDRLGLGMHDAIMKMKKD